MNDLFLKIINMSISASWLVLAVLLLRFVLKKAPKWVNVLLWGIVAVRLAFPFSIESALSLIPSAETVPMDIEMAVQPTINSGVPVINSMVNPMLSSFAPPQDVLTSANPLQIWIPIFSILWIAGIAALLYIPWSAIGVCAPQSQRGSHPPRQHFPERECGFSLCAGRVQTEIYLRSIWADRIWNTLLPMSRRTFVVKTIGGNPWGFSC